MLKELLLSILLIYTVDAAPLEISEEDMPALPNVSSPFRGKVKHPGYVGHTWVGYPHVENPASLDIDPLGRIFVAEAHRFNKGVPDLRSNRHFVRDDFKSRTVGDRLEMYRKYQAKKSMDWYTQYPERLIRLQDLDGNGVADQRSLFSDAFDEPLDGIGFSVLAERDFLYFTCIPALRKLSDTDDDGVADTNEKIVDGFGVRVSFTGHDLHGIIRGPDGRLYFTVGDRGYHVTDENGQVHEASGRGAVFRCDSDGSNFEVYGLGLRNPQELAFDDNGNLFTFDNNGDIGDKARVVYVLDNADSGWDMSHQSPHQYVRDLDWGDFHLRKSVWVGEKMFDKHNLEGPQWHYPPVGLRGNGPSGVTRLTGLSVPDDLRGAFILTDYRGAATKSETLAIKLLQSGSGFKITETKSIVQGLAASDVEHGYDGNLYFADYGGGWSTNTNGSIQVLRPVDEEAKRAGSETARMFAKGFSTRSAPELKTLLGHPDQRVRQASQFALVEKGETTVALFDEILADPDASSLAGLHALWGLGQLYRSGTITAGPSVLSAATNPDSEIRANTARVIGDSNLSEGRSQLLELLKDSSPRVSSLAAIALGRICPQGDTEAVGALLAIVADNTAGNFEVTQRHSLLSGLSRVATPELIAGLTDSESIEQRLMAVLLLRRWEHENLGLFLSDSAEVVRLEVIRAIYDTKVMDSPAGDQLLGLEVSDFPFYLQARLVGASFRKGSLEAVAKLGEIVGDPKLDQEIRVFALQALMRWSLPLDTDPVLGHYRPTTPSSLNLQEISAKIGPGMKILLEKEKDPKLASLLSIFAQKVGLSLDSGTLRKQVVDQKLDPEVRVANLLGLMDKEDKEDDLLLLKLLKDENEAVRAASFGHLLVRGLDSGFVLSLKALKEDKLPVARAVLAGLIRQDPTQVIELWRNRELAVRPELWLDLYLALSRTVDPDSKQVAATYAAGDPGRIHALSLVGGDPLEGEKVFRNQGACLQCHKIASEGGVQGPELSLVGDRLDSSKLLESLVNPSAEITPGYGLSNVSLVSGTSLIGRIPEKKEGVITVISPDGKSTMVREDQVKSVSPPVSAMPPLGLTLPPADLRNLIEYLKTRNKETLAKAKKSEEHGK
jgi:quinoprotein glucose dehydrogenase